jgi:hypothetical protein
MNITLGVYDLFTYAVPGSLYLTLVTYIATRLDWIHPSHLLTANATLTVIAAGVASYLIGHITYAIGREFHRRIRAWNRYVRVAPDMAVARREFTRRVPVAQGRPFLQADRSILLSAVELHDTGAAVEIARLHAVGLMLRDSAPVFILSAAVALVDLAIDYHPVFAACCLVAFTLCAIGCFYQSARLSHWANLKTLECAFWVPGIDTELGAAKMPSGPLPPPKPPRSAAKAPAPGSRARRRPRRISG